ncbi:MAG: class I tRNA ligase family protein [Candidatus Paceibacterota bacterium]|jgi:isoleucyl-tRNA synthetase
MQEEKDLNKKSETALREERILEFWKENKIFAKSLNQSKGRKEFVFYEGPPTANGKPGIHHLEARAFKDAIPRYKTMRGYHVRRKGGWDTHGLPVELQVEKKLGLNSKKAIEEYGIAKFNQECKESVWEYLDIWNKFTRRIGFWVDQENPYVTYHNNFIESVWNIVQKVNAEKLLYKDYKVVPWCPRCGTVLSSHELAQGYEDVKDLSVTAKFKIKGADNTYILAWTTTPWTLPGNVALAVGQDIDYVKIKVAKDATNEFYFLAKAQLSIIADPYEIVEEIKGEGLVGLEYEPLFPYFLNTIPESEKPKLEKAYKVHKANFVTTDDGTGVVHTAVMYGQDDFLLGVEVGLPKHHLVGLDGKFLPGTGIFEGRFVKDEEVAVDIIKDLAHRGLLYKKEKYEHSYPHCWRCHTALIYYARDSWYIKMSDPKIKSALITENKDINWEPSHIREGRFGEWLREIKDWAISRERYWGTPLPVWHCEKCKKIEVLGSVADLEARTKKSGNKYFVMRHGQAGNNLRENIHTKKLQEIAHLTDVGQSQVLGSAKNFKEKIDIVISSPYNRARETTKILCEELNFPLEQVIYDKRIQEWETSTVFDGKDPAEFLDYYRQGFFYNPREALPGGESFVELVKRVGQFIYELEQKYSNKNIFISSHDGVIRSLNFIVKNLSYSELTVGLNHLPSVDNAQISELAFVPLPHNETYELDLHRPYIDEINLVCDCGGKLVRTKEVMDVWFDSGAMPFAQDHYPFENQKWVEGKGYPADFIAEAIDQTRGWFYTLHAIGVLMGKGKAFKNVICLGHLMDSRGKKMSKSLGNIVDPWEAMDKYGVDTLRLWMYSVNQPGESKNFDEKTVALLQGQVFGLLYNVLFFYELYRDEALETNVRPQTQNVLDIWILGRMDELIDLMTKSMDSYKLLEPVRAIRDFIGDLSTWYLRRSRERIKDGDNDAKRTLYYVLKTLSKLLAPFAPFAAEDIWQRLRIAGDKESVHLESWPTKNIIGQIKVVFEKGKVRKIILDMKTVRNIVSAGLKARQLENLPVKQPLTKIKIKITLPQKFQHIIAEELNIKKVEEDKNMAPDLELDTELTAELKEEGNYRELVRALQELRKKTGLTPSDTVKLIIDTNTAGQELVGKFETDLKKTVLASEIKFAHNDGEEIKINNLIFRAKVEKEVIIE